MTAPRVERPLTTVAFAVSVAFVCALIVSTVVYLLRPIQFAVASLDYTRAVLVAAGIVAAGETPSDGSIIDGFLAFDVRIVDLEKHGFTDTLDPAAYDYRVQVREGQRDRLRFMPVYLKWQDGRVASAVLPFYGPGMWSTIHGFVALGTDLATVSGVMIFDHGETPGIGDRIQNPEWLAGWRGKRLYDDEGRYRFHVASNPATSAKPFAVDAITGATVTVEAVEAAMAQWFGEEGYARFLAALREGDA